MFLALLNALVMSFFALATGQSCSPCPYGWLRLDSTCFFFTFQDFYGTKKWPKAKEFCESYGGDLAIIDTKDKEVKTLCRYYLTLAIDNR